MFSKIGRIVILVVLALSFNLFNSSDASAATNKVMWGKTELKLGQVGKITILKPTELVKLNSDGSLSNVRTLKKGEEFRVYSYKSNQGGLYGVGGGSFIQNSPNVKYETPSKNKLALLKGQVGSGQFNNGKWFTSANEEPGIGINLTFISNTKAKIDLYGIWWSRSDGSDARESNAYGNDITFDNNGIGKVTFIEGYGGNKGVATVKLSGNKVTLTVTYPDSYEENEMVNNYIYEGTHVLVQRKF